MEYLEVLLIIVLGALACGNLHFKSWGITVSIGKIKNKKSSVFAYQFPAFCPIIDVAV